MILPSILDCNIYRSVENKKIPFCIETPAKIEWLPAVISTSRGKFQIVNNLYFFGEFQHRIIYPNKQFSTPVSSPNKYLVSGVFQYNHEKIDDLLPDLISTAFSLSLKSNYKNVFLGKESIEKAFKYITKNGGDDYPKICLVPENFDDVKQKEIFGQENLKDKKYKSKCEIRPCKINCVVFLSRPDMVGLFTQMLGGYSSIFLHNVKLGMAFLPI